MLAWDPGMGTSANIPGTSSFYGSVKVNQALQMKGGNI